MSIIFFGDTVGIFSSIADCRLDIGPGNLKKAQVRNHDSWATRLCFVNLDNPSDQGEIKSHHTVGLFSLDRKHRLDIGDAATRANVSSSVNTNTTKLKIRSFTGLVGPVHFGQEVAVLSEDEQYRLDIGSDCMKQDTPSSHNSWATRLNVRPTGSFKFYLKAASDIRKNTPYDNQTLSELLNFIAVSVAENPSGGGGSEWGLVPIIEAPQGHPDKARDYYRLSMAVRVPVAVTDALFNGPNGIRAAYYDDYGHAGEVAFRFLGTIKELCWLFLQTELRRIVASAATPPFSNVDIDRAINSLEFPSAKFWMSAEVIVDRRMHSEAVLKVPRWNPSLVDRNPIAELLGISTDRLQALIEHSSRLWADSYFEIKGPWLGPLEDPIWIPKHKVKRDLQIAMLGLS